MPEHDLDAATPAPPARSRLTFGPVDIVFDESVLVPRPWTIAQSAWARQLIESVPAGDVLELCSGAGHIGLAAVHGTGRHLVQVDHGGRHRCVIDDVDGVA